VAIHTFNILSICSGVGGLELGLKLAVPNSRVVCYVEGEAYAAAVLEQRMADKALDCAPIWSDLRTFDGKPWRGKVDCIAGGYPCQPFSHAGHRKGKDDPRHLWPVVARLIGEVQPAVCFFENVRGHLSLGFYDVARDLQQMGYAVKAGLFSAAEVGAPHGRERLFILAYRDGDGRGRGGNPDSERHLDDKQEQRGAAADEDGLVAKFGFGKDGTIMADGVGECVQRCKRAGSCKGEFEETPCERGGIMGAELPLFPPSPEDFASWERVPENLKPSVLRVADGLANRLDRIRACGNGVIPLVAAYAWRTLTAGLELKFL
jgi:DNA (cytosine-5)-methyltransferase 1